jgi:hypothetical protein
MESPRTALIRQLNTPSAIMNGEAVVELIEQLIDNAIETHRQDAPHPYPDGSTY